MRRHFVAMSFLHSMQSFLLCTIVLLLCNDVVNSIELDCDPCVRRKDFRLKAILHGTSSESFWLQVQSSMQQAALDMGVQLQLELRRSYVAEEMAQEIETASLSNEFNALIVTIPDAIVKQAVQTAISERNTPIFGFNQGFEVARDIGVLGFAAQDEYVAGAAAAQEFLKHNEELSNALFVDNKAKDAGVALRYLGFKDALEKASNTTIQVDLLKVDPNDQFDHVTAFQDAYDNCRYDAILLGTVESLDIAVSAKDSNSCVGITVLGSFDETEQLIGHIVTGKVAFGVSQQQYIQAAMPVYFAAIYATTGKALALPVEERVYLAGPTIINRDNVPSDTLQQCSVDAFPVCPNELAPDGTPATCACSERSKIKIAGVLHGVTTDTFWDPVFASAEQAAKDMGIDLDLIRFEPRDTSEEVHEQMAARIKTLCETGIDGIFVTIPSTIPVAAIQRCQELDVPVVSVNSGGEISRDLGLLNHIGMLEYSAGYGAGERMIAAGIKRGFCVNHATGNIATATRCQAFSDAIADHDGDVVYGGEIPVPLDNQAEYTLILEQAVGSGDWDGEGILMIGPVQIPSYQASLASSHPAAIVGTFDVGPSVSEGLESGLLQFGVDQQPYLQGNMPVILLALEAYTKQSLKNFFIESGPNYVTEVESEDAKICEANFFEICPDRPPENFNFINDGLVVFGLFLFVLLLVGIIICGLWTFVFRNKWVVKISQPVFLYIMLFGMIVSSLSIPFLGVETEYRLVQDEATGQLTDEVNPDIGLVDASCMLVPWFYGLGFAITFSAIFAKIQRVKLIYLAGINMQRKQVTVKDVLSVVLVMLGIEFVILFAWQLASPYRWQREVTQEDEGFPLESVGACESKSGSYFLIALVLFHVICLIYALVLSYQTKDINNEYAESSYLFLTVMFLFQVQCLVIPILALVQDTPDVFYFIQAIAVFSQNFTIIALIFGPKVYKTIIGEADPSGSTVPGRNARTSLSRLPTANAGLTNNRSRRVSGMSSKDEQDSAMFDTSENFQIRAMQIARDELENSFRENALPPVVGSHSSDKSSSRIPSGLSSPTISRAERMESANSENSHRNSVDVWTSEHEKNMTSSSGIHVIPEDSGSRELPQPIELQEAAPTEEPKEKEKDADEETR